MVIFVEDYDLVDTPSEGWVLEVSILPSVPHVRMDIGSDEYLSTQKVSELTLDWESDFVSIEKSKTLVQSHSGRRSCEVVEE